jgi:hypothetical protein
MAVALAGPAIPLTAADGIAGLNSARDLRYGLMGSIYASTGTGVDSVRPGVIPRIWDNSIPVWTDFRILPKGSPSRFVTVSTGWAVAGRSGQGFWSCHNSTATDIQLPAADGTNPRWDIVWIKVFDKAPASFPSDPQHGFYVDYTAGTPAGSPTVPSTPTDAIKLAEVFRPAGATGDQIDAAKITDKRKSAGLHSGTRILLPGDASTDAGGYHGEHRLRTGSLVPSAYSALGYTEMLDRWSAVDSKWHGVAPGLVVGPTAYGLQDNITNGEERTCASTTIADPGYTYRLRVSGSLTTLLNANSALNYRIRLNNATTGTIVFNNVSSNADGFVVTRNNEPSSGTGGSAAGSRYLYPNAVSNSTFTGAITLYLTAHGEHTNGATVAAALGNSYIQYEIIPA